MKYLLLLVLFCGSCLAKDLDKFKDLDGKHNTGAASIMFLKEGIHLNGTSDPNSESAICNIDIDDSFTHTVKQGKGYLINEYTLHSDAHPEYDQESCDINVQITNEHKPRGIVHITDSCQMSYCGMQGVISALNGYYK